MVDMQEMMVMMKRLVRKKIDEETFDQIYFFFSTAAGFKHNCLYL